MPEIIVHKAQRHFKGASTEDLSIQATEEIPELGSLDGIAGFAGAEAAEIERALYDTLPGATYDRLLGFMLARKSTHFVVSHR